MDTRLNLYPDKMIAQCINAISLLSDANEALSSLKFEINEFVNDSYIQSVSFDELKKQCQNYVTVIDAMISCNEADIADFGILESVLDGVHEDLIGEKIDYWEKYYQALKAKYKLLLESTVNSQLQAYFGTLYSTYQELYNMWYAKELLYYEVDGETFSLFAKSNGRQVISNMLASLKASFTLNDGYSANVVAAQRTEIKNVVTEMAPINPAEKAAWDALIQSGKTYKDAANILTDIRLNHAEILERIEDLISSAGYTTGVLAVGQLISKQKDKEREKAIEVIKRFESFSDVPYNGGKTIGYGTDIYLHADLMDKWSEDNPITELEADELLKNEYQRLEAKLNEYLSDNSFTLSSGSYVAAMDLLYNRNMNDMTKEVIRSMAINDIENTKRLLEVFDYEYAKRYLDVNPESYVNRNKGLKIRREEEYNMFLNGIF